MNDLTEVGQVNEGLARRYGGQSPLLHTMASDLFPTVPVSDQQMDAELHYLMGGRLCVGSVFDAAPGVGINAQCGIQNPTTSGVIAVVEVLEVLNFSATTRSYDLRFTPEGVSGAPDATNRGLVRDSRYGDAGRSGCLLFSLSSAATVGTLMETTYCNNGDPPQQFVGVPIVLAPNSQLNVYHQTANESLQLIVRWRERRINAGEAQRGG